MSTKTELHTHLMGMLTAKQFLKLISAFTSKIYWPINEPITENSKFVDINDIIKSEEFLNALRIRRNTTVNYQELNNFYHSRTELLKYAIYIYEQKCGSKLKAETLIYSMYVNECLKELINQGVEYVEISYSIPRIINNIIVETEIQKKIKSKFLLSTDRSRPLRDIKRSCQDLKMLLDNDLSAGFDIMGQEIPLTDIEKDYSDYSNNSQSFKRKLELLLDTMNHYKNSTLRIHSGETKMSFDNTEQILIYIKELKEEKKFIIPPPEIRIGHGIYFNKNEKYLSLLREFGVIVEINASSNLALGNIHTYSDLPYDYYLNSGIKVVLSTDGHGLYHTTIPIESTIAQLVSNNYEKIISTDDDVIERKK
ncbi:MAG: hypothetical protein RR201_02210 [Malacoplasma sp.]